MAKHTPDACGRYWGSAEKACLVTFPEGDAMLTFEWNDGALIRIFEVTHDDARATLTRLGYAA